MKIRWNSILNFLILLVAALFLGAFQTTFWFQLFGGVPGPLLWLNLIVYVTLYRKPMPAILTIYAIGFALLTYSAMPLKMIWINSLIIFTLVYVIKTRVFWSGSGYYTIMCAFSSVAFQVCYFLTSLILEKNSTNLEFMDRLVQIILTPSFAFPMYWALSKLDRASDNHLMHEAGGLEV